MKLKKSKIASYVIMFFLLTSCLVAVTYNILNNSVKNLTIQNVNEISEHDMRNIQSYISGRLDDVNAIITELRIENPEDLDTLQNRLKVKVLAGRFSKVYLIDENGRLYADNYLIYESDENIFKGYFNGENGKEFARRYNDESLYHEFKKEYLLYGIDLKDNPLEIAGIKFTAAVALNDIAKMQKNMLISGCDNKYFSSVINRDGYYIINMDRKSGLDKFPNFFDMLEEAEIDSDLTELDILEIIQAHEESIEFSFTDKNGVKKYMQIKPIENTNWCFINTIEISFFADQTHIFMIITIGTILALIAILAIVFITFRITNSKLKKFYETSIEGVYNRRFYDDKLKEKHIMSFVMFDLDHLKYINDGSGHLAGDLAIAATASTIRKHIGNMGYVVRYGGDEFAVAFKGKLSEEEFHTAIDNILNDIREVELEKFPDIRLTLSIGGYYGEGVTSELFKLADKLLYEAKKTRNSAVTNIDENRTE